MSKQKLLSRDETRISKGCHFWPTLLTSSPALEMFGLRGLRGPKIVLVFKVINVYKFYLMSSHAAALFCVYLRLVFLRFASVSLELSYIGNSVSPVVTSTN